MTLLMLGTSNKLVFYDLNEFRGARMGAVAQKDKMVAYFGEFYELWLQF